MCQSQQIIKLIIVLGIDYTKRFEEITRLFYGEDIKLNDEMAYGKLSNNIKDAQIHKMAGYFRFIVVCSGSNRHTPHA